LALIRRDFIRLVGKAAIAWPFIFNNSGCVPIDTAADPITGLSLGYVAGDMTDKRAVIWLRAQAESQVAIQYGKDPALESFSQTAAVTVNGAADDTAHVELVRLEPSTRYYYRAAVLGKKPGPIARFVTAPAPDEDAAVKFCFSGDSRESYQPFTIMDAIRAQQPDFFLHLGDTIYADRGGIAKRLPEFWAKYRTNRADPASQRLFAATGVYVVWDDHEIADNYAPDDPLAPVGRRAFFDYWPVRRNAREPDRIYRSFRWGRAMELFILDVRQYRDPATGTILGSAQKRWLFDRLALSKARFKIIASSVPFYGGGGDKWDGFPPDRAELLQWVRHKDIQGLICLCADVHYAAVSRVPRAHGLKEIIVGPMAAPVNVLANGNAKRFEFFSNETFNYGMITIDPKGSVLNAKVEILDENNRRLYETRIDAQ
jgi:alkaline phosphatase D